jgi:hypothetical protein
MQHIRTATEEVAADGSYRRGDNQVEDYGKLQEGQLCFEQ